MSIEEEVDTPQISDPTSNTRKNNRKVHFADSASRTQLRLCWRGTYLGVEFGVDFARQGLQTRTGRIDVSNPPQDGYDEPATNEPSYFANWYAPAYHPTS